MFSSPSVSAATCVAILLILNVIDLSLEELRLIRGRSMIESSGMGLVTMLIGLKLLDLTLELLIILWIVEQSSQSIKVALFLTS
jgi:DNA integrity scanning protein DisA with diadenylate cyclase activity